MGYWLAGVNWLSFSSAKNKTKNKTKKTKKQNKKKLYYASIMGQIVVQKRESAL